VFRGTEARVRSSCDTLGDAAVHPNTCANFSDAQFEEREIWNAQVDGRTFVPHRIASGELLEWTPVWSLRDARVRYVPTAYCYYGYRDPANIPCLMADSNGCAAGNTIEEAILQGFLELVERDAVGIWWYNEIAAPVVDLTTFPQRSIRKMVADYASAGRSLEVLDLTTDLGIPVFAAVSFAPSSAHPLLLGFGAHLDAGVALGRAITELNQWRTGSQLGQARPGFSKAWNDRSDGEGPGHFLQRRSSVRRKHDDFPQVDERDLSGAIRVCVARAAEHGLDTLVLDQTREDIGLPVVRVIVPGSRHFWPRFGPGRLYDIPIELGWRSSARTESQLNNFHILI
jgi:ribosomal protein S12 methylthiotransferase accessory factor